MAKQICVIQTKGTKNIEIFYSSFERQVGDNLSTGKVVLILADEAEKQEFIRQWNARVNKINYQQQKQAKQQEAAFWANLYINNPIIRECMETMAMAKAMGE